MKFLDANGLKKSEVADYLGVSKQYISQLSSGAASLSQQKVALLRENEAWDTSMFGGDSSKVNGNKVHQGQSGIPLLPFSAVAGYLSDNNRLDSTRGESVVFKDFSDRGADCLIRVDGDSMYPRYCNGDILAIKILRDPTFFQWGRTYVISTTQGCVIKKLFHDRDDRDAIICHSENSDAYPDYRITKEDILAVAIVIGHAGVE